jgi:nicotinamide-nucleotide amidase
MNDGAHRLINRLRKRGLTIATAESCTGGGLAARLTSVAGASAAFLGGVVAYDNRIKRDLLGVPSEILEEHGAVSPETAVAMATGARERLATDIGVASTGIAGPGGGSAEKPVGLVYIAVADDRGAEANRLDLSGDRADVQRQAVDAAVDLILGRLNAP